MFKSYNITSIRILPSDKDTFPTEEEFRFFVKETMPGRGGLYYFPSQMMQCPASTLVLFQYDGMIRAVGILIDSAKETVVDERGVSYAGYYKFDIHTLHYLDIPIDRDSFSAVYSGFRGFNQTKQIIPNEYLDVIVDLLKSNILSIKRDTFISDIENDIEKLSLQGAERKAVVKVRVNQGIFRERLLAKYKSKCCLCGVSNKNLLMASHIKPWSESKATEKLDDNNGLLLCPNHDKLFDDGWISFDDDGYIVLSGELSDNDRIFMNVRDDMKIELTESNKVYLEYHRNSIFRK